MSPSLPTLFNGPLETGIRAVIVLNALHPMTADLGRLIWLDHLVVHTADIGGPPSLHPEIPQRTGELLVRRSLVEKGVELMVRSHLIEAKPCAEGIVYLASEEAAPFVELMQTPYGLTLRDRAMWLATRLDSMTDTELSDLIERKIGRWALEFQGTNYQQRAFI
jgi:hypothetical protein